MQFLRAEGVNSKGAADLQVALVVFAVCLSLGIGESISAQCLPPRFHKARDFSNSKLGTGSLYLSIDPSAFSIDNLICLAQTLRRRHPEWKTSMVLVFSSHAAAENFSPPGLEAPSGAMKWANQLHAAYFLDSDKREEYLQVLPMGLETGPLYETKIDLPIATTPHCRLEMTGRCLFAIDPFVYPSDALKARASGSITVMARITREGKISSLEVVDARVSSAEQKDLLTKAALENLETWWFEKANYEDTFRMTFSYVIDSALPHRGDVEVNNCVANPGDD